MDTLAFYVGFYFNGLWFLSGALELALSGLLLGYLLTREKRS